MTTTCAAGARRTRPRRSGGDPRGRRPPTLRSRCSRRSAGRRSGGPARGRGGGRPGARPRGHGRRPPRISRRSASPPRRSSSGSTGTRPAFHLRQVELSSTRGEPADREAMARWGRGGLVPDHGRRPRPDGLFRAGKTPGTKNPGKRPTPRCSASTHRAAKRSGWSSSPWLRFPRGSGIRNSSTRSRATRSTERIDRGTRRAPDPHRRAPRRTRPRADAPEGAGASSRGARDERGAAPGQARDADRLRGPGRGRRRPPPREPRRRQAGIGAAEIRDRCRRPRRSTSAASTAGSPKCSSRPGPRALIALDVGRDS